MTFYRRDGIALVLVALLAMAAALAGLLALGEAWSIMLYDQFPIAAIIGGGIGVIVMGTGLFYLERGIEAIETLLDQ
jgi:hypothetical protein